MEDKDIIKRLRQVIKECDKQFNKLDAGYVAFTISDIFKEFDILQERN